jgi:hypothetical protein
MTHCASLVSLDLMGFGAANANSIFELRLYPVFALEPEQPGKGFKIPYDQWSQVMEHSKVKSLRTIAKD